MRVPLTSAANEQIVTIRVSKANDSSGSDHVDFGFLVDPFGVLSKNVSLAAFVLAAWLLRCEGRTPRAEWTLARPPSATAVHRSC